MASTPRTVSRSTFLLAAVASGLAPLATVLAAPERASASRTSTTLGPAASLGPLINIPQTWNNCGPASIAEVLAYWGISRTQGQVQDVLRVDGPSAGMTPYGIRTYARGLGLRAVIGVGGTATLLKRLVAGGFPVIVHQVVSLPDPVGHWRPIEAYDDRQGVFVSSDPYLGPNHQITYGDFAQMWAQRGYAFTVLYPASRQAALSTILAAAKWDKAAAYRQDLALLRGGQLDASPAGTPASASDGYRYLGMAWDEAQLGQLASARAYLQLATRTGANPIEVRWVGAEIG